VLNKLLTIDLDVSGIRKEANHSSNIFNTFSHKS